MKSGSLLFYSTDVALTHWYLVAGVALIKSLGSCFATASINHKQIYYAFAALIKC